MERLDELSKLLAESVSRRESLRSIGAVLAGAVLSSLGLGTAWAARPDRCTAFCRWCPTKKKRNQCLAACRACNGNTSRLCGSCGDYVCCPTGAACCNGTCTDCEFGSAQLRRLRKRLPAHRRRTASRATCSAMPAVRHVARSLHRPDVRRQQLRRVRQCVPCADGLHRWRLRERCTG